MKIKYLFALLSCSLVWMPLKLRAQNNEHPQKSSETVYSAHNKGKFYVYWGWNRGYYSHSDIHFRGSDYDFTIYAAKAHDHQSKFSYHNYFQPDRVTIPQTDVRVGYFITDHYNISLGIDHMKYIMTAGQMATINGYIDVEGGHPFNGDYHHQPVYVDDDLLHFEHTDGLNFINVQIERYDDLGSLLGGNWNMDVFQINLYEGLGAGILVPKTNATVLDRPRRDKFHLSGFGLSAHEGLNFTFFKHYFMQVEIKEGYINMADIRTSYRSSDRASQHFFFLEPTLMFGGIFRI